MRTIFFPSSGPRFIDAQEVIQQFRSIAEDIAHRHSDVESIILFGSYASGTAGSRSDVDILVVLKHSSVPMMERFGEYMLTFSDGPVPADVLVYTREELDTALLAGNRFLKQAAQGIRLV